MIIWKWTLDFADAQTLDMPTGAQILNIDIQAGKPRIWALVNENAPKQPRVFNTYGTGKPLPEASGYGTFVGTYQLMGGSLVFHVFAQD